MTYQEAIKERCEEYAKHDLARFIGYNTRFGSRMYSTLNGVPDSKLIETPVAENLMAGMAVGLALEGYLPVVCFERHDFILLALDAIVNHIDKLPYISGNQFRLPIIIRAIIGSSTPLNPGVQHTQNYSMALMNLVVNTPVYDPMNRQELIDSWAGKGRNKCRRDVTNEKRSGAIIIIEHKDWYSKDIDNILAP